MSRLTEEDREFIAAHLDDDETSALQGLGEAVLIESGTLGAFPPSVEKLIATAKSQLQDRREEICQALRADPSAGDFISGGKTARRFELACIIGDVLSQMMGRPTYLWMAIVIVRLGLAELCPDMAERQP